jgi:hypothetical protein
MTDLLAQIQEERAAAEDRLRQERAAAPAGIPPSPNRTSPGYVHAVSPEGHAVVFVPGEALPSWAVEALDSERVTRHPQTGVLVLNVAPK